MTVRQQLARAALAVLHPEMFHLNIGFTMAYFCNGFYTEPNVCGTSCCYGGHYIVLHQMDGNAPVSDKMWSFQFEELTGIEDLPTLEWLTSGGWLSDINQCAERVRMYLEGEMPKFFSASCSEYPVRQDTPMVLREFMEGTRP